MEAAKALDRAGGVVERLASEIGPRGGGDGVVEMKLGATTTISSSSQHKKKKRKGNSGAILSLVEEDEDDDNDDAKQGNESMQVSKNNNRHQMEIDMHASSKGVTMNVSKRDDEARKTNGNNNNNMAEKREHKEYHDDDYSSTKKKDYWLYRDIIVRIINKKLSNGQYYKRKAIVDKVIDKYEAEVEVLESSRKANDGGDILRLDQDDLETVIPKELGEKVRILVGKHRGKKARVLSLNKMDYQAELRLSDDDRVVTLNYEDFSKLA